MADGGAVVRWVERPGGARIPFVLTGSGGSPHVVFAHSLMASGLGAGDFYQPLLARGWTIASPDLRGHGQSSASTFALEEWGADLLAVMDSCGWERAWLGGGSLGAAVALAAAAQAPDRVEGLILLAPAHGRVANCALRRYSEVAAAYRNGRAEGDAALRDASPDDAGVDGRIDNLAAQPPATVAAMLESVAGWTLGDALDRLGDVSGPVVLVAWAGDPVHPMESAQAVRSAARDGRIGVVGVEVLSNPSRLLDHALALLDGETTAPV